MLSLVTAVLAGAGTLVRNYLKARLAPGRLDSILNLARTVTAAAEKMGNTLNLNSGAKYNYAETALLDLSKRVGVKLTPTEANAFIHAVLHEAEVLAGSEHALAA